MKHKTTDKLLGQAPVGCPIKCVSLLNTLAHKRVYKCKKKKCDELKYIYIWFWSVI